MNSRTVCNSKISVTRSCSFRLNEILSARIKCSKVSLRNYKKRGVSVREIIRSTSDALASSENLNDKSDGNKIPITNFILENEDLQNYEYKAEEVIEQLNKFELDAEIKMSPEEYRARYGEASVHEKIKNIGVKKLSIEDIKETFHYELDDFQIAAIEELLMEKSVVVCAPTGAGKTAIADAAALYTLAKGKRVLYTTPLKALSNQKLYEFRERFGFVRVGLSTGDTSIRLTAPIIVMTTEILRNLMYRVKTEAENIRETMLDNVGLIVLDEVHYLGDRDRGSVWEELIVGCPTNIQMLCMSATVANPSDLGDWIAQIHGPCSTIKTNKRPVPLTWFFGFAGADGVVNIEPLFLDKTKQINPKCVYKKTGFSDSKTKKKQQQQANPENRVPKLEALIIQLRKKKFLPAIYFVFSRIACDNNAQYLEEQGVWLTSQDERKLIAKAIQELQDDQPEAVKQNCIPALLNGIATHHAGCLPAWKLMVETLFQQGLLKLVFATGTLAAGINMPARTTIIEKISLRRGEQFEALGHNELLQMAGRAGRRGYDTVGNCIILQSQFEGAEEVINIIKNGAEPLQSQFTTGYSLVLNLLSIFSLEGAREFLEKSFQNYLSGIGLERRETKIKQLKKELKSLLKEYKKQYSDMGINTISTEQSKEELNVLRLQLANLVRSAKKERAAKVIELLRGKMLPYPVLLDITKNAAGKNAFPALLVERGNGNGHIYCLGSDNFQYRVTMDNIVGIGAEKFPQINGIKEIRETLLRTRKWEILNQSKDIFSANVMRVKGGIQSAKVAFLIPAVRDYIQVSWNEDIDLEIRELKTTTDKMKKDVSDYKKIKMAMEEKSIKNSTSIESRLRDVQRSLKESLKLKKSLEKQMTKGWLGFKATMETLIRAGALDAETLKIKPLGDVVREMNGDNELWLAIVFTHPSVQMLSPSHLAAFVSSLIAPSVYSRPTMQTNLPAPTEVTQVFSQLEEMRQWLFEIEVMNASNPSISVSLDVDTRLSGLVEAWASGCTWAQVMSSTSLDDGDLARLLSRTQDMLRQISSSKHLLEPIRTSAKQAWTAMNRKPLKDMVQ